MQTIYYSTRNFIRHTDGIIDLTEYRRRLALAQEGNLAPVPAEETPEQSEAPVLPCKRRERRLQALDLCASLGVLVMTLTFTLRVLMM